MAIRGIRGAVQAERNSAEAIKASTRRLLEEILRVNHFKPGDIASATFTVTEDLDATFPAEAARAIGWTQVPMICSREIPVPGALPRTVRALLLINTRLSAASMRHVYLGATQKLRPDLAEGEKTGKSRRRGATQKLRARLLGKSLSQSPPILPAAEDEPT